MLDPGGFDRLGDLAAEALDGVDLLAGHIRQGGLAGADRVAVDMLGAGAPVRPAAPELAAGQADLSAHRPEARHVGAAVKGTGLAVEGAFYTNGIKDRKRG